MTNVLYIDPDAALASVYARAFEHVGYAFVHAATAQEALALAEERQPDVVVLELQLVAHDGIEFLHEFRSYEEWMDIPVIVVTHMPQERLLPVMPVLMRDFGVRACLYKPETSLERLLDAVSKTVSAP